MAINPNELILDRVRELILTDLADGSILARLTSLEDPSLNTSAEGTDVTDAIGAVITTLYRAKNAEFTATNSLLSLDLAARQFGTTKTVASTTSTINTPTFEILTVSGGKITLKNTPSNQIKYIYKLENGNLAKKYTVSTTVSNDNFTISDKTITVPTGVTGDIYVEYEYAADSAVKIVNNTENFPEAVGVKIFSIFRDKCNENIKYAGCIVATKGKLDPSQIQLALTTTGKHPFTIRFNKDYCQNNADLFSIIVAE